MNDAQTPVGTREEAALAAELNSLLQLDYDAVAAYALALNALEDAGYQAAVRRCKIDHERHIDELTELVRSYGGVPMPAPTLSGPFKLAVQTAGSVSDVAVIRALKASETQSRDKYRRAISRQHPVDVQNLLIRAARDEQRHFDWVMRTLAEIGMDTIDVIEPGPRQPVVHTARDGAPMKLAAAGLMLLGAGAAVMILRRRR